MTASRRFVAMGECMIEMAGGAGGAGDGGNATGSGSVGGQWKMGIAGDTLNTAWHFRKSLMRASRDAVAVDTGDESAAGDWQVSYVTALGDDHYSAQIAAFIAHAGIDISAIQYLPGKRPGLYLIGQENGDRVFTYWRENSAARRMADDIAALRAGLDGADVIYLSGITLAILSVDRRMAVMELLRDCQKSGARLAFDPNIRPALWESPEICREWIVTMAGMADFVLPSFDDETRLFGDADPMATARRYGGYGAPEVIVKDGGNSCHVWCDGAVHKGAIPAITKVVDATGAGDSFNAAYLAARLCGAGIDDALRAGQELAGFVIGRHGALPQ